MIRYASALLLSLAALGALPTLPQEARAADDPAEGCEPVESVDRFRYLRQLTLDLWGRVPSIDELTALEPESDVPPALIDQMLDDEQFYRMVRRHHADMLWPNIDQLELVSAAYSLLLPAMFYEYDGAADNNRLFIIYTGLYYRGAIVPCADEPAKFADDGSLILEPWPDGTMRDGWVMVTPYWAPDTQVKVCALEAQELELAPNGLACNTFAGVVTGACSCGPGLVNCLSIESGTMIREAFQQQMQRAIEAPIRAGAGYFEFLRGTSEELNGALAHYYKHIAQLAVDPIVFVPPVLPQLIADRPFLDPEWRTHDRFDHHSGILTSMLYMLRFQTSRARANRFWDAFLCSPFQAPGIELPSPNDPCSDNPNLRERCGCNGCHAVLEPATAYWARFSDAGTLRLDGVNYPAYLPRCATCAASPSGCDFVCERYYLTRAGHPDEQPYVGTLLSLMWRDPVELAVTEIGPSRLVADKLEDGSMARCATQKMFERLHGRDMTPDEYFGALPAVTAVFETSGYDFKALVRAWVTSESYRRLVR